MSESSPFAYASTRIRARDASRLDPRAWGELDASRGLRHYLERTRGTELERWTRTFDPGTGWREIERGLRAAFGSYVHELAEWMPEAWREAVRFVSHLVYLPLHETRPAPDWAHDELSTLPPELLPTEDAAVDPLAVWLARFAELWPAMWPSQRRALEDLCELLSAYRAELAAAERTGSELDVSGPRLELAKELSRRLRRHPEQPVMVFLHLALVALDLERLRAALLRRALFDDGGEAPWA